MSLQQALRPKTGKANNGVVVSRGGGGVTRRDRHRTRRAASSFSPYLWLGAGDC